MPRPPSLYLPPHLWQEPFALQDEEAHHLLRVLRARAGDTIRLFDGQGRWGLFAILSCDKKTACLKLISQYFEDAPQTTLTLAVGWSKGLRRGFVLEKAVELGATAVWFWQAARSQGEIPDAAKEGWHRQMVAAAKQCEALWLPQIQVLDSPLAVARRGADFTSRILCWEEEQEAVLQPQELSPKGLVVLGPEGGLTTQEAAFFQSHGFCSVSLGPGILRFETAAMYVLSLYRWSTQQTSEIPLHT